MWGRSAGRLRAEAESGKASAIRTRIFFMTSFTQFDGRVRFQTKSILDRAGDQMAQKVAEQLGGLLWLLPGRVMARFGKSLAFDYGGCARALAQLRCARSAGLRPQ